MASYDLLATEGDLAMKHWTVVPQVEFQNCEAVQVLCRHVKTFPVVDAFSGETSFRLLPSNLFILQVVVEESGERHKLKIVENADSIKYVWQKPNRLRRPTTGKGLAKTGRGATSVQDGFDMLSPFHWLPGEESDFGTRGEFVAHLDRILGSELAAWVMELFRWRRPLCVNACERNMEHVSHQLQSTPRQRLRGSMTGTLGTSVRLDAEPPGRQQTAGVVRVG